MAYSESNYHTIEIQDGGLAGWHRFALCTFALGAFLVCLFVFFRLYDLAFNKKD